MLWHRNHEGGGLRMLRSPASKSLWEKANPLDSRAAGRTRALVNSKASASSDPSRNLGPNLATGSRAGGDSIPLRTRVNSLLVTAFGAVKFTGPRTSLSNSHAIALISSSRVIQLHHWAPDPNLPPRPSLNSGSSLGSAPPCLLRTTPVRAQITLIPAAAAGAVSASQRTQSDAKKSLPVELCSVRISSPRSP